MEKSVDNLYCIWKCSAAEVLEKEREGEGRKDKIVQLDRKTDFSL